MASNSLAGMSCLNNIHSFSCSWVNLSIPQKVCIVHVSISVTTNMNISMSSPNSFQRGRNCHNFKLALQLCHCSDHSCRNSKSTMADIYQYAENVLWSQFRGLNSCSVFAVFNAAFIPTVYFFYPETALKVWILSYFRWIILVTLTWFL